MKHSIAVSTSIDQNTGYPDAGGRVLFVRLPRDYVSANQPDANDVGYAFGHCGLVSTITQVDQKGGFFVTLGGELPNALQTAEAIISCFNGKANLHCEDCVTEMFGVHERVCGALIGQRGANLRDIKARSGAHLEVTPWSGNGATRIVQIWGSIPNVAHAQQLIHESIQIALEAQAVAKEEAVEETQVRAATQATDVAAPINQEVQCLHIDSTLPIVASQSDSLQYHFEFPPLSWSSSTTAPATGAPPEHHIWHADAAQPQPRTQTTPNPVGTQLWQSNVVRTQPSPRQSRALSIKLSPKQHLVLKAHWCLLKDRVCLIRELKTAVRNFSEIVYQTKLQAAKAKRRAILFGVRSKSWANFMHREEAVAEVGTPSNQPKKPHLGLQRTCSTELILGRDSHAALHVHQPLGLSIFT